MNDRQREKWLVTDMLWKSTSDKKLMGPLVNKRVTTILAAVFIAVILSLNAVFLYFALGGKG